MQRAALLPRPCYLTFADEAEGDAYVRRLEQLLDRGVVPPELLAAPSERHTRLRDVIVEYRASQPVSVAERVLREYLAGREIGLVFPWWRGEREDVEMRRCTSLLSRQFGRVFDAAGCGDLRFHDLRHEATSRLYERTRLSDLEIAKITGHKSLRMLARYANLRGSDLAARLW